MIARMLFSRFVTLTVLLISLLQAGCTKSDTTVENPAQAYAASGGLAPATDQAAPPAAVTSRPPFGSDPMATSQSMPPSLPGDSERQLAAAMDVNRMETNPATPFTLEDAPSDATANAPQAPLPALRDDLSPEKLVEVLEGTDKDMQVIVTGRSGITDPKEARRTLIHFMNMKLEASRRLMQHPESSAKAKSEGARGELQALSHLAAVGDLKAAEALEELAERNLTSEDARLAADSRLVLIGFAIESLQNGKEEAASRIVDYVEAIRNSATKPDIPAMMAMGQARETLAKYGHQDEAQRIRDTIIDLFANSPDPQIAQMAGQLAGNVRFDAIESLRSKAVDGEPVSVQQWRQAIETLIDESADLQTVKYIAGASLEFESRGLDELVTTTFDVASRRFDDPESAPGREIRLAIRAHQARKDVIGQVFDPQPVDDAPQLRLSDYQGKVVLIPFWASGFPESLQLIPRLKSIQDRTPDDVAIVGVNLDPEEAPLDEFLKNNELGFPSIRAKSSGTEVATQFGLVSFPFVAILDQKGQVAAINFTGFDLEKVVTSMVSQ